MSRIILCTARYSDNLGDAVISECMYYLLKNHVRKDVIHLDISGRSDWNMGKNSLLKYLILRLPSQIRKILFFVDWSFRGRRRQMTSLKLFIKEGDVIIFGGGQLILDNDWIFPFKINAISDFASKRKINIAFVGCGVGGEFGYIAKLLYSRVFTNKYLKYISLRDELSIKNLNLFFNSTVKPVLTYDAALFTKNVFNIEKKIRSEKLKIVGLCITNPMELGFASRKTINFDRKKLINGWSELALLLAKKGYAVVIYTNGSAEDEVFKNQLIDLLEDDNIKFASKPKFPNDLVNLISEFDYLIAHRLHSSIIAASFGVGSVGLSWDNKVKSFYKLMGAEHLCLSGDVIRPRDILNLIMNQSKFDCGVVNGCKNTVGNGIVDCIESLDL